MLALSRPYIQILRKPSPSSWRSSDCHRKRKHSNNSFIWINFGVHIFWRKVRADGNNLWRFYTHNVHWMKYWEIVLSKAINWHCLVEKNGFRSPELELYLWFHYSLSGHVASHEQDDLTQCPIAPFSIFAAVRYTCLSAPKKIQSFITLPFDIFFQMRTVWKRTPNFFFGLICFIKHWPLMPSPLRT